MRTTMRDEKAQRKVRTYSTVLCSTSQLFSVGVKRVYAAPACRWSCIIAGGFGRECAAAAAAAARRPCARWQFQTRRLSVANLTFVRFDPPAMFRALSLSSARLAPIARTVQRHFANLHVCHRALATQSMLPSLNVRAVRGKATFIASSTSRTSRDQIFSRLGRPSATPALFARTPQRLIPAATFSARSFFSKYGAPPPSGGLPPNMSPLGLLWRLALSTLVALVITYPFRSLFAVVCIYYGFKVLSVVVLSLLVAALLLYAGFRARRAVLSATGGLKGTPPSSSSSSPFNSSPFGGGASNPFAGMGMGGGEGPRPSGDGSAGAGGSAFGDMLSAFAGAAARREQARAAERATPAYRQAEADHAACVERVQRALTVDNARMRRAFGGDKIAVAEEPIEFELTPNASGYTGMSIYEVRFRTKPRRSSIQFFLNFPLCRVLNVVFSSAASRQGPARRPPDNRNRVCSSRIARANRRDCARHCRAAVGRRTARV
jgi:hypothetical protein